MLIALQQSSFEEGLLVGGADLSVKGFQVVEGGWAASNFVKQHPEKEAFSVLGMDCVDPSQLVGLEVAYVRVNWNSLFPLVSLFISPGEVGWNFSVEQGLGKVILGAELEKGLLESSGVGHWPRFDGLAQYH